MKKALIILYYWPPAGGSAVQRWLKFSKYLPEFGWQPIIYAPENAQYPEIDQELTKEVAPDIEIVRRPILEPFQLYRKFVGIKSKEGLGASMTMNSEIKGFAKLKNNFSLWIRSNFFIPDARFLWIRPSVKYLKDYLKKNIADVIVTTGPPHSMHLIGLHLHESTGIPWVADFRDPWTSIDFYTSLSLSRRADKKHHRLEEQVLKTADQVIAIGHDMEREFLQIGAKKVTVISNGYDEADIAKGPAILDEKFSIVHLGTLSPTRNSSALWKALAAKASEDEKFASDLSIHLIGKTDYKVIQEIESLKLSGNLVINDYVPHHDGMKILGKSQVLLLLINNSINAKGVITGKFFEYLAAGRPVLMVGPTDGDAAQILHETNGGLSAGFEDERMIRKHIDYYYNLFLKGKLIVESHSVDQYSRRKLSEKLARTLDSAVAQGD